LICAKQIKQSNGKITVVCSHIDRGIELGRSIKNYTKKKNLDTVTTKKDLSELSDVTGKKRGVQKQKVKARNSASEMVTLCKNSSTRMVDGSKDTSWAQFF